jgi:hypothetical protein
MRTATLTLRGLLAAALVWLPLLAAAATFQFSIDATPLEGQSGYFAFDLYQGDPGTSNQVVVSSFSSTATLGAPSTTGDVTGDLQTSVTINSTTFFGEFLQPVVFGAGATTFRLATTENYVPPNIPDGLAIFLLDDTQMPFATSDPSGADALIAIDLVSPQTPKIYTSAVAVASLVPEPGRALLLIAGLPLVLRWGNRRSRASRAERRSA